ncbi:MAG TPA: phosphotransferase [Anaerolineae bacterium]|nr:phosphotransferase [Anaerolineae bacterium]
MPSDLAAILARIPAWRDRADIQTTFLSGGITNQNYRVDVGQESFVLRISGSKTELLGIDRTSEYAANHAAAEIGIAPEVVYFIEPEGYLVTRFLQARPIPPEEMHQPQTICEIAATLKRVHALPPIPGTFSPFQVVREYDRLARENNVMTYPENYAWLRERMDEIETAIGKVADAPVPCHNDLLNGNFLRDEQGIRILDWEYAGMGDRFFDLSNFSAHHELEDEEIRQLLMAYFGQATPRDFAHLKLLQAMSDFREAMWGILQQGISELDFDFRGYADQFFNKLTTRLNDPRYSEWLAGSQ